MTKPKPKQKYNKTVPPETFVKAWQTSATTSEVLKKTGMKLHAARTRASLYRKRGIPLKYMGRKKPLDVEALTKLAVKCGEE